MAGDCASLQTLIICSVSMALPAVNLDTSTLARFGILHGTHALLPSRAVLELGWPEFERALPDRGLPRGVVEIAARSRPSSRGALHRCPESMRGGATTIAVAAMRSVHATDAQAWCAWVTPSDPNVPVLYAPALVQANVDLDRLLVVCPPLQALARTVVKIVTSGAFSIVVIDLPHRHDLSGGKATRASCKGMDDGRMGVRYDSAAIVVRRLALAAEECGTTSLLLTSALTPRSVPWPVTMRIEVERRPDTLSIRVTKDRRGVAASQHVVRLPDSSIVSVRREESSGVSFPHRAG